MHNNRVIVTLTLILSASWLVYYYNPQIDFDTTPEQNEYLISLENINIKIADNFLWQGDFKAKTTKYLDTGLSFNQIHGQFHQGDLSMNVVADSGFWPHHDHLIYLYKNIKIDDGQTSFYGQELVIDLENGTCMSPSTVTWEYGKITAMSPNLEEKFSDIKKSFWNNQ